MATSGLRSFLLFALGLFVAFLVFAFLMFRFVGHKDAQDGLTVKVPADVLDIGSRGHGSSVSQRLYVRYEYRFERHTYQAVSAYRSTDTDGSWRDVLSVCVDPDDPTKVAPILNKGHACGDKDLGRGSSNVTAVTIR